VIRKKRMVLLEALAMYARREATCWNTKPIVLAVREKDVVHGRTAEINSSNDWA